MQLQCSFGEPKCPELCFFATRAQVSCLWRLHLELVRDLLLFKSRFCPVCVCWHVLVNFLKLFYKAAFRDGLCSRGATVLARSRLTVARGFRSRAADTALPCVRVEPLVDPGLQYGRVVRL